MAISNGINYNQTQGLKISTNSLNRVIVSTAGTTTFTGVTSGSTLIDVRGASGQLMSIIDTNTGAIFSVNDIAGNTIFQVNSNNSIIGGTPNNNTFVISGNSVGIGTILSPTNTLHISASTNPVRVEGLQLSGASGNTRFLVTDSNGVVTYRTDVITTNMTGNTLYTGNGTLSGDRTVGLSSYTLNFSSATNPNTLVLSGGSVGVGKSPVYKLDVNGDINFTTTTGSTYGVIRQNGSRILHTYGTSNLFLGNNSGNFTTIGAENIAIGSNSLLTNTTGNDNLAFGYNSLLSNKTGSENIGIGAYTLAFNTGGSRNIAIGYNSLNSNTTGNDNIGFGRDSVGANTTGSYNLGIGNSSLKLNTTGDNNLGIGNDSLSANTVGVQNLAIGRQSLKNNTTANNNLGIGYNSLNANTTGYQNIAIGVGSLASNTTANDNLGIGLQALASNTTGTTNLAIGTQSLLNNTTGSTNLGIGVYSLFNNTRGDINLGIGAYSLFNNTTGRENIAIGSSSLRSNNIGTQNLAIGIESLFANSIGEYNMGIGHYSLRGNTTGGANLAIGRSSLFTNTTGGGNVAIGNYSLYYNNGGGNIAIGYGAGYNETGSNKLHIANNSSTTLIYGEFDNGRVGINTITPTNALTVSATTDPLKLINVQSSTDTDLLTIDGAGVVHQITINSILSGITGTTITGAPQKTVLTTIELGTRELGADTTANTVTNLTNLFNSRLTDTVLYSGDSGTTLWQNYIGVKVDYYTTSINPTTSNREKVLWSTQTYGVDFSAQTAFETMISYFDVNYVSGTLINFYSEIYLETYESYGSPSQVKLTNTLFNSLNPNKYSRNKNYSGGTSEFVRNANGLKTVNSNFIMDWSAYYDVATSSDIISNVYDIIWNEPAFYGPLSAISQTAIAASTSGVFDLNARDLIQNTVYTESFSNFYSKFTIPTNVHGFYPVNKNKQNNYYGDLLYDIVGGSSSVAYSEANSTYFTSNAFYQIIDTYRISSSGTPYAIYNNSPAEFAGDTGTTLTGLTNQKVSDLKIKYLEKNRDKAFIQVLPGYQYVYILKISVVNTPDIAGALIAKGQLDDYFVPNDPSIGTGLTGSDILQYLSGDTAFNSNPYGPYLIIQSNDTKMAALNAASGVLYDSGGNSILVDAIYKGYSFKPMLYPLNLNQLHLEVASSLTYTGGTFVEDANYAENNFTIDNQMQTRAGGLYVEWPDSTVLSFNETILSVATQSDGNIYIGGKFTQYTTSAGTNTLQYFGRLNSNYEVDTTFNVGGTGFNNFVYSIAVQPDGKILVGGDFDSYNDVYGNYFMEFVARLNTDGTFDTTFNNGGTGFNSEVYSITIQSDGKILVGGNFDAYTDINGTYNRNGFIRLNSDGTVDTTFNNVIGAGFNGGNVYSIAIQSDGKILVGGLFSTYADVNSTYSCNYIARLNSDGTFDTTFNVGGSGFNNIVNSIAIQSDGKILVGGIFDAYTDINGINTCNYIARLNSDGTFDTTFNNGGTGFDNIVKTIAVQTDGIIICGGDFASYTDALAGYTKKRICALNSDGTANNSFIPEFDSGFNLSVYNIAIDNYGAIFAVGEFFQYGINWGLSNIMKIYGVNDKIPLEYGYIDGAFNKGGLGFDDPVVSIAIQPDEKVMFGGAFTQYNGSGVTQTMNYIARLNTDGSFDTTFNVGGTGFDNYVNSVAVQSDGKTICGGVFSLYQDDIDIHYKNRIFRLNADGRGDVYFNNGGSGFNDVVYSIAIQSDEKILVGGDFTNYDDVNDLYYMNYIARLNTDGTFDTTFNVGGTGFNSAVRAITIQSDGKILCGGNFDSYTDVSGNYFMGFVARLNTDGTFDATFNNGGSGFNGAVYSITIQPDGKILVGGYFDSYNDVYGSYSVDKIARLNSDGTFDTTFNNGGTGFNNQVNSITIQSDGKILVGGLFDAYTDINGTYNNIGYICRLNNDGSFDTTFNPNGEGILNGGKTAVNSIVLDKYGRAYVGGDFNDYDRIITNNVTRIIGQKSVLPENLNNPITNKELRFIVKYVKLQKYDIITTPIKMTDIRGIYDNKFFRLTLQEFAENFEMNIYKNISNNKRKQLRPGSVEIYLGFYDTNTKKTSIIPNYKIVMKRYGDNEVFKLIRGSVVSNIVSP